MTWWRKEPGHRHQWYCLIWNNTFHANYHEVYTFFISMSWKARFYKKDNYAPENNMPYSSQGVMP